MLTVDQFYNAIDFKLLKRILLGASAIAFLFILVDQASLFVSTTSFQRKTTHANDVKLEFLDEKEILNSRDTSLNS